MDTLARFPDPGYKAPLQGRMHVLVLNGNGPVAGGMLGSQFVEPPDDGGVIPIGQVVCGVQHFGVSN